MRLPVQCARSLLLTVSFLLTAPMLVPLAHGNHDILPIIFHENFDPPGDDAPDRTVGAGSRTDTACPGDIGELRSHMPARNYGLTLQSHPGVYVQLPTTTAQQVVLAFRNESGTHYERAFLPLPTKQTAAIGDHPAVSNQTATQASALTSGNLVRFALPDQTTPLIVGENYQWILALVCGDTVQPDDPILTGWVQRTAANVPSINSAAQIRWFAQNGYWYEFLDALHPVVTPGMFPNISNFY